VTEDTFNKNTNKNDNSNIKKDNDE